MYVVVEPGETLVEPGAGTPPMVLSISTASAFVTAPQFKVLELPVVIVVGDAVNEAMFGVPTHPLALEDEEAADDEDDPGGAGTVILTETDCPKTEPFAARIFHCPV